MLARLARAIFGPKGADVEHNRIALMRKNAARIKWQISFANEGEGYTCTAAGDVCEFAPNLIESAKRFVLEQEKSNPDWAGWVEEWKNSR